MPDARSILTLTGTRAALAASTVLLIVMFTGCSQVETIQPTEPVTDPAQLYVRLTLNHPAVNLTTDTTAPAANTLQLVATPYNGIGTAITDAPEPVFTSMDTTVVTVTPEGLLQGRRAGNEVRVAVELTVGPVRHTDTAVVNVQDVAATSVPALDTFSIHVPPDSAVWYVPPVLTNLAGIIAQLAGVLPPTTLSARAVDATGNPIQGLTIEYTSLDSSVAVVNRRSGEVTPVAAGYVPVLARTVAFGVSKADTMTYTVQPPFSAPAVFSRQGFVVQPDYRSAPIATIVAGGIVVWQSSTAAPMDVTFDDPSNVMAPPAAFCDFVALYPFFPPSACAAGNIPTVIGDSINQLPSARFRQFPLPGTYAYHSTTTGATGQVVVLERTPLP